MFNKNFVLEKIIYLVILVGVFLSFWTFEENLLLKIIALLMLLIGCVPVLRHKENHNGSNFELLNLTIIYLGFFSIYNLLYSINLPIYAAMTIVLVLVILIFFSSSTIDGVAQLFEKSHFFTYILLSGFVITELFLSLYFWSIDPGIKSLVLVVAFYQIFVLVYLHARSMLRLNRIKGYLLINILILATIFLSIWLKSPR